VHGLDVFYFNMKSRSVQSPTDRTLHECVEVCYRKLKANNDVY
jgi:hypothetical protein